MIAHQIPIDVTALRKMWADGMTSVDIGKRLGVSKNTVERRVSSLGLVARGTRRVEGVISKKAAEMPAAHVAAVTVPEKPLQARKDWPDLQAAVMRAKDRPAPQTALAMIAARFRLPVAQVQGLAGRIWG